MLYEYLDMQRQQPLWYQSTHNRFHHKTLKSYTIPKFKFDLCLLFIVSFSCPLNFPRENIWRIHGWSRDENCGSECRKNPKKLQTQIAVLVSDSLLPSIHLNYAFTFETGTHTSPLCLFPVHYQPNLLTFARTYF